MKTTMVALKSFTYNTRRLKAGDEFTVPGPHVRLLSAIGRAEVKPTAIVEAIGYETSPISDTGFMTKTSPISDTGFTIPPPPVVPPVDTMSALRAEYQDKLGKRAFPGWNEAELRRRIAEHEAGNDGSS